MEDFKPFQASIQNAIMASEYDHLVESTCPCGRGGNRQYRCSDCSSTVPVCALCLIECHKMENFHWAERWTGLFFERMDMSKLGLRVHLGHHGDRCEHSRKGDSGSKMIIVDINGIHLSHIIFCECAGRAEKCLQLVRHGIFPSSTKAPELGFTFRCLRDFHVHTHTSRKSAFDYMKALGRMTNDHQLVDVAVRVPD